MRTRLPLLLLAVAASLYAAPGDVPLSPVRQAPLTGIVDTAVATSGMEYLIVYRQPGGLLWQRIALNGVPIDPVPGRVEHRDSFYTPVRVVWTGSTYMAFWSEPGGIAGLSIKRDGTVSSRFTVPTGVHLGDAFRHGDEIALHSSNAMGQRHVTILDPRGEVISATLVPYLPDPWLVWREGTFAIISRSTQLTVTNPTTGAAQVVASDFRPRDVYASPAGGALVVTHDGRIGVVPPSGPFVRVSFEHPIELLSEMRSVLVSPAPSGWAVIYKSGGSARIARVQADGAIVSDTALTGAFPSPGGIRFGNIVAAGADDEHHLLVQPAAIGLEAQVISNGHAALAGIYAVGDATQKWARIAHGPGLDFVVWLEAGDWAWTIRATRVRDGLPLDGEGIILASGYPYSLEAEFDGNNFAVVWREQAGTFLRRVGPDGTVIEDAPTLLEKIWDVATIASSGDGVLLIGSQANGQGNAAISVIRDGSFFGEIALSPLPFNALKIGGSPDGFLAASIGLIPGCRMTCPVSPLPVQSLLLTAAGSPVGELVDVAMTDTSRWKIGTPVSYREEWFLHVTRLEGSRVVRLTGAASPIATRATIEGTLHRTPAGIEIWGPVGGGMFRGLLSDSAEPLWFEPLPVAQSEGVAGPMNATSAFLVESGSRYVLRPLLPPARSADLALVHRGRVLLSYHYITDEVTIEHRGGDTIDAVDFQAWTDDTLMHVSSSRPIVNGRIEGPFAPGESITLTIRASRYGQHSRLFVALPAGRETAARDNFIELDNAQPPRPRRRIVGR